MAINETFIKFLWASRRKDGWSCLPEFHQEPLGLRALLLASLLGQKFISSCIGTFPSMLLVRTNSLFEPSRLCNLTNVPLLRRSKWNEKREVRVLNCLHLPSTEPVETGEWTRYLISCMQGLFAVFSFESCIITQQWMLAELEVGDCVSCENVMFN